MQILLPGNDLGLQKVSLLPVNDSPLNLEIPRCGLTVCDNPEVIENYLHSWEMRTIKKLRYRIVVLTDNDGRFYY